METKNFSHFKYYIKRLKEMGFKAYEGRLCGPVDLDIRMMKKVGGLVCGVQLIDWTAYYKHDVRHIRLAFGRDENNTRYVHHIYKIGFDNDFEVCANCRIINEYPTWRSAFNQLVKDFHELEKNTHKRIHKGVSIHET